MQRPTSYHSSPPPKILDTQRTFNYDSNKRGSTRYPPFHGPGSNRSYLNDLTDRYGNVARSTRSPLQVVARSQTIMTDGCRVVTCGCGRNSAVTTVRIWAVDQKRENKRLKPRSKKKTHTASKPRRTDRKRSRPEQ